MRTVLRNTVRRVLVLLVAFSTFIVGLAAFYFYAEAASFLFKPEQPTPETTQMLTTQLAAPQVFNGSFTFSSPESQTTDSGQQEACANCIQDDLCGLCEPVTGEYENYNYTYAMTIPDELRAMKPPEPAINHGFIARLEADTEATIEVEGNFNKDSGWGSLNEAANAHIDYLKASSKDVVVLKRSPARLGKLAAIRYVIQYTSISTGLPMIEDKTISFRKDSEGKEYWTVYSISLQTPAARYERNIATLEKVLKRWKETVYEGC